MRFSLYQLSPQQHRDLADPALARKLRSRAEQDALPPPHVLSRVIQQLAEGCPPLWICTFVIIRTSDQRIVGGCGFKGQPVKGRVEIGYGVSPSCRRQGAAATAVAQLLNFAFSAGATEVVAEILPDNQASTGVVEKNGFSRAGTIADESGTLVVQWVSKLGV